MFELTEKRFSDFFRQQPETGMGYWIVTAVLKNGQEFEQVVVDSGYVTKVKGFAGVPFEESEIDHFIVTHDKWNFNDY
jgi:hypothetical protein